MHDCIMLKMTLAREQCPLLGTAQHFAAHLSCCSIAGDGTLLLNPTPSHQVKSGSAQVQQSFASAFRRDRSIGPKRTGQVTLSKSALGLLCLSPATHNLPTTLAVGFS